MSEHCIVCGVEIPEGRQICPDCEQKTNVCPCIECVPPKRFPGCHDSCPEYRAWSAERKRKANVLKEARAKESRYIDYFRERVHKTKKRINVDPLYNKRR